MSVGEFSLEKKGRMVIAWNLREPASWPGLVQWCLVLIEIITKLVLDYTKFHC